MAETRWTSLIKKALLAKGEQLGYDTSNSNKKITLKTEEGDYEIRPDVVWEIDNKKKVIFEIDTGAYGNYPKTIFGSMLTGILMAKKFECTFVEIIPRLSNKSNDNSFKAKKIASLFKKSFESPKFFILDMGYNPSKKWAYENIHKNITSKLKKFKLIPPITSPSPRY